MLAEAGTDSLARIRRGFRLAVTREPASGEVERLKTLYETHLDGYRRDPEAAAALLKVGEEPLPPEVDPAELAAWTSVARVLLNLQETITRG